MDNVYTVHIQHSDVFGVPPFSSTKECVNNGAGDEIQSRSFFNRLITIEYSRDQLKLSARATDRVSDILFVTTIF